MFARKSQARAGLVQLQTATLIGAVAIGATGGFIMLGQGAKSSIAGSSAETASSSANPAGSSANPTGSSANPTGSSPVLASRSEAAGWLGRMGRAVGRMFEQMDDNTLRMGIHGEDLVRQKYADRIAAARGGGADPSAAAVTNAITPPNAVAGAPKALVHNWRGGAGNLTEDMRYFENRLGQLPRTSMQDGVLTLAYPFSIKKMTGPLEHSDAQRMFGHWRTEVAARGGALSVDGDTATVTLREQVGLSDQFAAQVLLRSLGDTKAYDAATRQELIGFDWTTANAVSLSTLAKRAGMVDAGSSRDHALLTTIRAAAPRSAADRLLSQLIVEHGAKIDVSPSGRLRATLPGNAMLPAHADALRGLTRYDRDITFGIARPEGTELARLGSPLEFEFGKAGSFEIKRF